jgi:hypothetical protein
VLVQYTFTHKQYIAQQLIWEESGPCPVFASYTLAFALQLGKKHGKPSVRVRKTSVKLRRTSEYSIHLPEHPHISKPSQTHTLQNPHIHTHTHTLQDNIKLPQYKLKQNSIGKATQWGEITVSSFLCC